MNRLLHAYTDVLFERISDKVYLSVVSLPSRFDSFTSYLASSARASGSLIEQAASGVLKAMPALRDIVYGRLQPAS
jgi:hypothetical protein